MVPPTKEPNVPKSAANQKVHVTLSGTSVTESPGMSTTFFEVILWGNHRPGDGVISADPEPTEAGTG